MSWSNILDLATVEGDFYVLRNVLRSIENNYPSVAHGTLIQVSNLIILPGQYKIPLITNSTLLRFQSKISPGEMIQKWDVATGDDYIKVINIISEKSPYKQILIEELKELRDIRLKNIGI